jgi:hypothetical protein
MNLILSNGVDALLASVAPYVEINSPATTWVINGTCIGFPTAVLQLIHEVAPAQFHHRRPFKISSANSLAWARSAALISAAINS